MSRFIKICLIAGASLIAVGAVVTGIDYARTLSRAEALQPEAASDRMVTVLGNDNRQPAPAAGESGTIAGADEEIERIQIDMSGGVLRLETGDRLELKVGEKLTPYYRAGVQDGTFTYSDTLKRNWWKQVHNFDGGDYDVTLVLPQAEYARAEISVGTGTGSVRGLSAQEVSIECGAGELELSGVDARSLLLAGGAGTITARGLRVSERTEVDAGVGEFDIRGDLRGHVELNGGVGEVDLRLAGAEKDYRVSAESGIGEVNVGSRTATMFGGIEDRNSDAPNELEISCGVGAINVRFSEDIDEDF